MRGARIFIAALLTLPAVAVEAKELEVMGAASVPLAGGNPQDVKTKATQAAKRKAVMAAIDQILGPDASLNARVAPKIDAVLAQVPDTAVIDRKADRVENNYQVQLRIVLDDKTFRTLLSDQGVTIHTATVRASSVLAVMDEFLTTPRDLKAPVEELVEFRSSVGASFNDQSAAAAVASSKDADSSKSKTNVSVRTGRGSGSAAHQDEQASTSQKSLGVAIQRNVQAEVHDDQHYQKIIRYQPPNPKAEKVSQTYNALIGQLQDYDLRMVDNDLFRSRFFAKPITLDDMTSGDALAKYVGYARAEAKADFFMVGTSVIIDSGRNESTGEFLCSGLVTVKTFSTQSGESIASETVSEVASGIDPNGCAANVARKLAKIAGADIGARVQGYWTRRSTFGREYVLTLNGAGMTLGTRMAFSRAVKGLPGVENVTQRTSTDAVIELAVTYKGSEPLDQAVAGGLSSNAAFSTLDAISDGTHIQFCFGPCSAKK